MLAYETPNYYGNVQNTFAKAFCLVKRDVRILQCPKWFFVHSLGNMLVSAAIQDRGMECEKCFMLNMDVAMEACNPTNGIAQTSRANMTPLTMSNNVLLWQDACTCSS